MKKSNIIFLAFFATLAMLLAGCDSPEKMKDINPESLPKMEPNPLVYRGGKVEGKITGRFPAKYFHKKAELEVIPVLKYAGKEKVLPSKYYQGEEVAGNNPVINYDNGGAYNHEFSFNYEPEMVKSEMELRFVIHYKGKQVPFDAIHKLGVGVNTTPLLAEIEQGGVKPIYMPVNFIRDTEKQSSAQINFPIQRAEINNTSHTQSVVKYFNKTLKDAGTQNNQVKSVTVSAYASPDGPVALNDNLSKSRGKNTQNWLSQLLRGAKVDPSLVRVIEESTDWNGFKNLLERSDIQDKELILRVLSMHSDPDVRNREMHNLGKVFKEVADKILPQLRRSDMVINVAVKGKTDEEMKALVDAGKMDQLTVDEALYITTQSPAEVQGKMYQAIADKHNDLRAINNAAVWYLQNYDNAKAEAMLNKAAAIDANNPTVVHNQAVLAMFKGNMEEAEKLFTRVMDKSDVAKHNLGAIAILKGNYPQAVEYLSGANSFNQGLALLLADRLDAARNVLKEINTPKAQYALAILGARTGDEKMLLSNLRAAIGSDSKLKERAKTDVEFIKFAQNEVLSSLIK